MQFALAVSFFFSPANIQDDIKCWTLSIEVRHYALSLHQQGVCIMFDTTYYLLSILLAVGFITGIMGFICFLSEIVVALLKGFKA
jgi:hypothetical protein